MVCNYCVQDGTCCEAGDTPVPQAYNFNPDPEWQAYIRRFESMIDQIALKYCSVDDDLRQDVKQEARCGLATIYPETIHGFAQYVSGAMTEAEWHEALRRFCHQVIRNSILSYLNRWPTGNWYIGRTRHVRDKVTGKSRKVYLPPRYSSLDELVDDHGMQVDTNGAISWPEPSDDGLLRERRAPGVGHGHE